MKDTALIGPVDAPQLHVMSFNIRRRMPHLNPRNPDRWDIRKHAMRRMLAREQPALLGVQEALFDQAEFVQAALGPEYREIGYGRDRDRGGERCPIFWDSSRLRLEKWSQHALSDTPDISGSTTWGNHDPRIFVTAEFTDLATGIRFLAVNTHFDHRSPTSRLRSAEVIRGVVAGAQWGMGSSPSVAGLTPGVAGLPPGVAGLPPELVRPVSAAAPRPMPAPSGLPLPVIVTGDFNSDAGSLAHRTLIVGGLLRDSWLVAHERLTESWGTFPNYRRPVRGRKRIDWILATPTVEVASAAINVRRFSRRWPSDHAAVQAVVSLVGFGG